MRMHTYPVNAYMYVYMYATPGIPFCSVLASCQPGIGFRKVVSQRWLS